MCLKKILGWFKPNVNPVPVPEPDQVEGNKKTALLFAINDYPGSANDLRGCIKDQLNVVDKLNKQFLGFVIKTFKDSQVTRKVFITEVTSAINELKPGDVLLVHYSGHGTQVYDKSGDEKDGYDEALYLYDGVVIDDDIGSYLKNIPDGAIVVLMFDSCFSGTVTRSSKDKKNKIKFVKTEGLPLRRKKRIRISKEEMKWIVFSGCEEHQTSADAYINGDYNGAFTYYAMKTLVPNITYNEWLVQIKKYLPSSIFEQIPTLEGKVSLFDNKVLI